VHAYMCEHIVRRGLLLDLTMYPLVDYGVYLGNGDMEKQPFAVANVET